MTSSRSAVALLTGCKDRPYAFGLAMGLISTGLCVDVIGSNEIDSPEFQRANKLRFLNLGNDLWKKARPATRLWRVALYYFRLIRYSLGVRPRVLHILWNNNFEYFDRTVLMLCYKLRGKKIVLTAHNVNQAKRDLRDSMLNRLTLKLQYRLADHIFVHTTKMKAELNEEFGVQSHAVTVIRHPINNAFPDTELTIAEAKSRLGFKGGEKAILFFGRIKPYKGLECLIAAFRRLVTDDTSYRLIIAGEPKKGSENYLQEIQSAIREEVKLGRIVPRLQFIPDEEAELYLKAADLLVLPYRDIFQSGVLFLAYAFGLPVVASDVGSFREEIIEGRTGFISQSCEPDDLAVTIKTYFHSDLYRNLASRRRELQEYAREAYSWDAVSRQTTEVYSRLQEHAA